MLAILLVTQITIAVVNGEAKDVLSPVMILQYPATSIQRQQPKLPETIKPNERPKEVRFDDVDPKFDAVIQTPEFLKLAPRIGGYKVAQNEPNKTFGAFSSLFLMQTLPAVIVTVGKPFTVLMDHAGVDTTGYRLIIDTVQAGPDVLKAVALTGTVVSLPATIMSAGSHTVAVEAYGPGGVARSTVLTFQGAAPPPVAGTNIRITQP